MSLLRVALLPAARERIEAVSLPRAAGTTVPGGLTRVNPDVKRW